MKSENVKLLSPDAFGTYFVNRFHTLTGTKPTFNFNPKDPHIITNLPKGASGVYVFIARKGLKIECAHCLKVGQAGPNSIPRWNSHHYTPNGGTSTLPKSIEYDTRLSINRNSKFLKIYRVIDNEAEAKKFIAYFKKIREGINKKENKKNLKDWIVDNTCRLEFVLSPNAEKYLINFLESYLQWLLQPCYEGRQTRKTYKKKI